jgi:peptidoglycan/xylan/chitin deacetylase (PgdA/CDA1 family)
MSEKGYSLPVLLYHRVIQKRSDAGKHGIFVYVKQLREQLDYLKREGYGTITFRDLLENPDDLKLQKKVILTFDDGYVDNYYNLFPILKEYGFTAVIFLVTGLKKNEWGMSEGEPAIDLLSPGQIAEMSRYGIEFGSHTQTHPVLQSKTHEERKAEIYQSRSDVAKLTDMPVISFAYPFGGLNEDVKAQVKDAGYTFGIATKSGPLYWREDLMQIRRVEVTPRTTLFSFKRKVSGYYYTRSLMQYLLS